MFDSSFWFHNTGEDFADYVYAPTGIASEPPEITYSFIDTCSKGVYTGEIVLLGCATTDTDYSGRLGIGSEFPEQKLDVAGSVKIDEFIYDSVNAKGKNGYFLNMDSGGIRWIPPTSDLPAGTPSPIPGIGTEGIFVLSDGVPLY